MAGFELTTKSVPVADLSFNGGLNTTAGPMSLSANESPDLQNVDFNKFGSVFQRNGYSALNESAITDTPNSDGLYWFEFDASGTITRKLVNIAEGKLYKMDDLDGTWDDETNGLTITKDNFCSFATFLKTLYVVNGEDTPFEWDGTASSATTSTLPTNVTKPKYVAEFNNYLFYANVYVSGALHASRVYWSAYKDTSSWPVLNYIDIAKDDGQVITGIKVLGDRLVVYKERSIYAIYFAADADIPFILPGGGKTNSPVGCVAPWSIQEVENGHVFLSSDGFYYFDGNNSYKISDKITTTLLGYNTTRFANAVSMVQRNKNRYWCAFTTSGQTTHDRVIVWDWYNNAFTLYVGINASAMATVYVDGTTERPYFADYGGFVYYADDSSEVDDNPANVATKITSYYKTNWRAYDDLMDQKGIPHVSVYYQTNSAILTFGYSYDFSESDAPNSGALPGMDYTQTFSTAGGTSVYGTATYGSGTYASSGGAVKRRDLTGRGRVAQFLFGNNVLGETWQVDALGALPHLETFV